MNNTGELYFIAIIPSQTVCNEITRFKEEFAVRFASHHALKVVPHITLKAPFRVPVRAAPHLLGWFGKLPLTTPGFKQWLDGFGSFANERNPVIFVKPVVNASLIALQHEVLHAVAAQLEVGKISEPELDYKPHMTVSHRDLSPEMFRAAWQEYRAKPYNAAFAVDTIYLLHHDRQKWNVVAGKPLPGNVANN